NGVERVGSGRITLDRSRSRIPSAPASRPQFPTAPVSIDDIMRATSPPAWLSIARAPNTSVAAEPSMAGDSLRIVSLHCSERLRSNLAGAADTRAWAKESTQGTKTKGAPGRSDRYRCGAAMSEGVRLDGIAPVLVSAIRASG